MAQYTSEHGHQIFVHAEAKGGAGREVPSVAYVNRASPILNEDKAYRVAIERFYLHGVTLPLFSCDKVWKIGMRATGGVLATAKEQEQTVLRNLQSGVPTFPQGGLPQFLLHAG